MTFSEMLMKRESCRSFVDRPVAREQLINIVEAGRMSPSGCNAQPWRFIVADEPEAKAKVCDALVVEGGATGCPWRESVPAFIVVVEQPANIVPVAREYYGGTQRFAQGDIGGAVVNMCYAALEQGLSTCILGLIDQKKMETAFGIPEGREVRMVLAVGYGEDKPPRDKSRKPFDEICGFNRW